MPKYIEPALDKYFGSRHSVQRDSTRPTFIDLFAGIGGIRRSFEQAGADCVFTSEWDKYAVKTYAENYEFSHEIVGDIRAFPAQEVPDHDILTAGFPCQPFSLAGVSKKNSLGRDHGFLDPTQGTLFFNIAEILSEKQPAAFMLENVKNLVSHDKGNTFRVIREVLERDLGYRIHFRVLDAKGFVPQHRQRIIIIGFRDGMDFDWSEVRATNPGGTLAPLLHKEDGSEAGASPFIDKSSGRVLEKYTLSDGLWSYLQAYAAKHKAAGNGFGFGLVDGSMTTRTLSARYYKDGSEILIRQDNGRNPRRLTPRECARLMGFPEDFVIPVSDTQAYKQFGNSVAVPLIASVANQMVRVLEGAQRGQSQNTQND